MARRESLRAAGKRYQGTHSGKINHAKRQSYYRDRTKKVTHQGSQEFVVHDLLQSEEQELENFSQNDNVYCHFCGCKCASLLRNDFLNTHAPGFWPLGP
jgi:ribosomal protein L35